MSAAGVPVEVPISFIVKYHFESLSEPRHPRNGHHKIIDVMKIVVCGAIVGFSGLVSLNHCDKANS